MFTYTIAYQDLQLGAYQQADVEANNMVEALNKHFGISASNLTGAYSALLGRANILNIS